MIDYKYQYTRYNNLSFYGNNQLKQDLLDQLQYHYDQDQIIQGSYWIEGKGCHIGCCIHSHSHKKMSEFFGLPVWLCYLFDIIFEGLSNESAMRFPLESIAAIPVGVDLEPVLHKLAIWRLLDPEQGVIRFSDNQSIVAVAELHKRALVGKVSEAEWSDAAARSAAARSAAARSAAYAADSAARSAAYAADSAARSAAAAARYAVAALSAADASAAASAGADYTKEHHYQNEYNQLVKLLQSA